MKTRILMAGLVIVLITGCASPAAKQEKADVETLATFEAELESLRQEMKIPGMSAGVVKNGQLVWARGFGYSDVEKQIPATPETPYHLASVTKTFAALVIMQLVQEGKLSLDDPVSRYGVNLPEGEAVLVRHLMSHTSAGTPGSTYQYDGNRYGLLSQVIQAATGRPFQEWLFERILQPLGMQNTAPSPAGCTGLPFAPACERVFKAMALPYRLDENLNFVSGYYFPSFGTAAGLISTVIDLAKLDAALDANALVSAETKALMWTPTLSNSGQTLPYGLGWFTQDYRGTRLIWHYGQWPPSVSSLFLKIPDERLTFIVLANTDGLSTPFQLGNGDITTSLVALTFYKRFVLAPAYEQPLPVIDWSEDTSTLIELIRNVEDESVRDILSKEFAARRALASSLADLVTVNKRLASMRATAEEVARSLEPQTLDLYIGTYEFPEAGGLTVDVTRNGNRLYATQPGSAPVVLLPLSTTRFFVPVGYDYYLLDFVPGTGSDQIDSLILSISGMTFTGRKK